MKQTKRRILAWLMTVVLVLSVVTVLTPAKEAEAAAATAVSTHGKLAVKGTQLVDKNGQPFQIHGVSTHGLQWFGQYNNKAAYQTLRDDWGANAIRLAMYVDEGGYYSDRNGMKKKITGYGSVSASSVYWLSAMRFSRTFFRLSAEPIPNFFLMLARWVVMFDSDLLSSVQISLSFLFCRIR